jgi:prepilin-type N-terminal cleavage/methylation domain-containing protein
VLAIRKYMDRLSRRVRGEQMGPDDGFSLAELLVVVGIIAILAVIAVPMYLGQQDKAKDSAAVAELRQAKTGVASYVAEHGLGSGVTAAQLESIGIKLNQTTAGDGALTSFSVQWNPATNEHDYKGNSRSGKPCEATDSKVPTCG